MPGLANFHEDFSSLVYFRNAEKNEEMYFINFLFHSLKKVKESVWRKGNVLFTFHYKYSTRNSPTHICQHLRGKPGPIGINGKIPIAFTRARISPFFCTDQ